MSLQKIEKAIRGFLENEAPEVLSLKGGWGVGKTYFWNKLISNAAKEPKYRFERYVYISLFGISSLEELKFTIFEQVVNRSQIGHDISVENLKQNANDLAKRLGRKAVYLLQGLPWLKSYGSAIQSASFMSVRDTLICFDDLERKGDYLPAKDILGLVSLLKEQRNCKVVLIFNDSSMTEVARDEYKQFREKVIDIEVTYSPTAQEVATLVFPTQSDFDKQLGRLAEKLVITNVRILRKIQKSAQSVVNILVGVEPEVIQHAMHTLVLYGWCYYSHDNKIPTYEYVKSYGRGLYGIGKKDEKTEQENAWDAVLREYGYLNTDEFDLALGTLIETGFADETLLREEADKINKHVIANKAQSSFSEAWDLFHHTFANNEVALVNALGRGLKENAKFISPMNLNGTVRLLRELGKDALASELIDFYVKANAGRKELFDLDNYPFQET